MKLFCTKDSTFYVWLFLDENLLSYALDVFDVVYVYKLKS